jgi:hypothetical protein
MYIFAASEEAIYVSRFVDSRISYINHVPLELLGESNMDDRLGLY